MAEEVKDKQTAPEERAVLETTKGFRWGCSSCCCRKMDAAAQDKAA